MSDSTEPSLSDDKRTICLDYLKNIVLPTLRQNTKVSYIPPLTLSLDDFIWMEQNQRKIYMAEEQEKYHKITIQKRNDNLDITKIKGQLKQQLEPQFVEYMEEISCCKFYFEKRESFVEKYGFDKFMLYSRNKEYQDEFSYYRDKEHEKFTNEKLNTISEKAQMQTQECDYDNDNVLTLASHNHTLDFFAIGDEKFYNVYYYCFTNDNILDITKFKNIMVLDISNSNLTHLPKEINQLFNLRALICENNKITTIENIYLPNLVVLSVFNNMLTQFPQIESPLGCLHIGKNNIEIIPYKKILDMQLIVFLYFDNPFDDFKNNKNLRWLESNRQKQLLTQASLSSIHDLSINKDVLQKYDDDKKINIKTLKGIEEDIYGEFYMTDFISDSITQYKRLHKT
jgi:Leucine-rich repeat (LRR) protein